MKNFLIGGFFTVILLSSCSTSHWLVNRDDVYNDPVEEQKETRLAMMRQQRADSLERAKKMQLAAEQKARDDANPAYQDPSYNRDDYYDYQYASRIYRFSSPLCGASYFDPYYTNLYTYNQNYWSYGTSIYSTYNYWTPLNPYGYYNPGVNFVFGNPYSCGWNTPYSNCGLYQPYGGVCYYPSNTCNWNYNAYYNGCGYYSGYPVYSGSNGLQGHWGYFNSFDANSEYSQALNAPRGSTGAASTSPRTTAGTLITENNGSRRTYIEEVAGQQQNSPRFTANTSQRITRNQSSSSGNASSNTNNGGNGQSNTSYVPTPRIREGGQNQNNQSNNSSSNNRNNSDNSTTSRRITQREASQDAGNNQNTQQRSSGQNNSGNSGNSGSGSSGSSGSSAPRSGGGGGGTTRPR